MYRTRVLYSIYRLLKLSVFVGKLEAIFSMIRKLPYRSFYMGYHAMAVHYFSCDFLLGLNKNYKFRK